MTHLVHSQFSKKCRSANGWLDRVPLKDALSTRATKEACPSSVLCGRPARNVAKVRRMMKRSAALIICAAIAVFVVGVVTLLAQYKYPPREPAPSVLWSVSAAPSRNPVWLDGPRDSLPREMPNRWSPFHWASNASIIAGHKDNLSSNELDRLTDELVGILSSYSSCEDGRCFTVYDFDYAIYDYALAPPWYSALGNAYVAIGFMHLAEANGSDRYMDLALKYLLPIASPALSYRLDGDLWFSEYADELGDNRGPGVINGHFTALASLHEWELRTGDLRFKDYVRNGLRTLEVWLPLVRQPEFFAYSRDYLDVPDYGQERATNQAIAACDLAGWRGICESAKHYAFDFMRR